MCPVPGLNAMRPVQDGQAGLHCVAWQFVPSQLAQIWSSSLQVSGLHHALSDVKLFVMGSQASPRLEPFTQPAS